MAKGKQNYRRSDNKATAKGHKPSSNRTRYKKNNAERADDVTESRNDPRWYKSNQALSDDAATYPYYWPTGMDIGLSDADGGYTYNVPGIATLMISPAFGDSTNSHSALNVATTSVYQYIRAKNSGAKNYEAPDVGIYLIVMSSIISYITMMCRVYGVCALVEQRNRYFPEALVKAMGIDYTSIVGNLADFRYYINRFIAKVQSLPLPRTMALFERAAFLFQNYYLEGDSIKDQLYMYVPNAFYQLDYDTSGAGMAKYVPWWTGNMTYTQLIAYGENMLDKVLNDSDIPLIGGDIRKAYDEASLIRIASITPDFQVLPIRDDWFLYQFKNAFTTAALNTSKLDVTQDATKSYLLFSLEGLPSDAFQTHNVKQICGDRVITIDTQNPTADMTMEFTRLAVTGEWDSTSNTAHYYAGSEYATALALYSLNNGVLSATAIYSTYAYDGTNTNAVKGTLKLAELIRAFKYAPAVYLTECNSSGVMQSRSITIECDNFTVIDIQGIKKIHDAAFINELHIDRLAVQG